MPVVRNAQKLTLAELGAPDQRADRARRSTAPSRRTTSPAGRSPSATSAVFGVESFTPILNPPQVAILGVNAIQLKPVRRNGAVEFVDHIGLSLTCDHQVIDGAPGARFLKICREQIENVEAIADWRFDRYV